MRRAGALVSRLMLGSSRGRSCYKDEDDVYERAVSCWHDVLSTICLVLAALSLEWQLMCTVLVKNLERR